MTCDEAIEFIYSRLKFGTKPGFERITALCNEFGNPQNELKYIHVAGTNGKGSTSTMMAQILIEAGYKVGLFTSPYVINFRERMQINGEMISKDELAEIVEEIKPIAEKLDETGITPTEFEIITVAAFLFFSRNKCDFVVLEVGLGGLTDSTNIIKTPLASVITSVSMDHMNILGSTVKEIAGMKSGIIKKDGITVCYPQLFAEAEAVISNKAKQENNLFYPVSKSDVKIISETLAGSDISFKGNNYHISLIGRHQCYNAATAITAVKALKENKLITVSDKNIADGILKAKIPARMEIISNNPLVIMDGGHNEDGIKQLADNVKYLLKGKKLTVVMGMMKDKDFETAASEIGPLCSNIITTMPKNPRTLDSVQLKEILQKFCKNVISVPDTHEAFDAAKKITDKNDAILVCGSLYLASELRIEN